MCYRYVSHCVASKTLEVDDFFLFIMLWKVSMLTEQSDFFFKAQIGISKLFSVGECCHYCRFFLLQETVGE